MGNRNGIIYLQFLPCHSSIFNNILIICNLVFSNSKVFSFIFIAIFQLDIAMYFYCWALLGGLLITIFLLVPFFILGIIFNLPFWHNILCGLLIVFLTVIFFFDISNLVNRYYEDEYLYGVTTMYLDVMIIFLIFFNFKSLQ